MARRDLARSAVAAAVLLILIASMTLRGTREFRRAAEQQQPQPLPPNVLQKFGLPLPGEPEPHVHTRVDALTPGVAFLVKQQSEDGAWRSDIYATFKDGPALTPLVVCAIQEAGEPGALAPGVQRATRKGCEYLAKMVKPDGTIENGESGLDYPAYTAALAVTALSREVSRDPAVSADLAKARDAWLKYLLDRQLTEKLGWKPEDKQYGGWGYCRLLPKKPEPGAFAPPLVESNLSATVFALEALKAAGVTDRAVYDKALVFVRRCQNPDGGFHFIYDDPVRNKAGKASDDPLTFNSYGSTTADGLRCLILAGEPDKAKIRAATDWLRTHFKAQSHPGTYVPAHEPNRNAVFFYYAASAAKALRAAKVTDAGGKPWAGALKSELAKRQKADGSWANPVELVRENDPTVATAFAVIAVANCKAAAAK